MQKFRRSGFGIVLASLAGTALGQCDQAWSEDFVPAFFQEGQLATATFFDDGDGPRLIVSNLSRAGEERGLQAWDGQAWETVPGSEWVRRAEVLHVDRTGLSPRLYAAAGSSGDPLRVGVLADQAWTTLESPAWLRYPLALTDMFTDPDTGDLYLSGLFRREETGWSKVLRWDGGQWVALDQDSDGSGVSSMVWFDDGSGGALLAGVWNDINGIPARGVAKWDGQAWTEFGGECPASWPSLAIHDDGSGEALWALDQAGTTLAKWNGASWEAYELEPRDVGWSGKLSSIEVAGRQELVWIDALLEDSQIWRWDGVAGERLSSTSIGRAWDIVQADGALVDADLVAVGDFLQVDDVTAVRVATFDDTVWSALANEESGNGAVSPVDVISVDDESLGEGVYVRTYQVGDQPAPGIARWSDSTWEVAGPEDRDIWGSFALGDLGEGPRLFAAGWGNGLVSSIESWDGNAWTVIGDGIEGQIEDMAVGAVGASDPRLYFAGLFESIGDDPFYGVAALGPFGFERLDGLRSTFGGAPVYAVAPHALDGETVLAAGGSTFFLEEDLANGVVVWDGAAWTRLGDPLDDQPVIVYDLISMDLGEGPTLFAGGDVPGPDGTLGNVVAWDGEAWNRVGEGLPFEVRTLAQIQTDDGPRLGAVVAPDAFPAEQFYLWDGHAWTPFGAEADDQIRGVTQASHDANAVYFTGAFTEIASVPSEGIARFGCPGGCAVDIDGNGAVDSRDFIAFLNAWSAGDDDADFNNDGAVDTPDVIDFLSAWSIGC